MPSDLETLIRKSRKLASLPEAVTRTLNLINDPDSSATDIGNSLSHDPALTTRLLRIVNSPYYGFPAQIETVSRAITLVGTLELLDLILASSVIRLFDRIPPDLVTMDDFWDHSIYTSILARILARRSRAPDTERYFIAGLIHDVGELVLFSQRPEQSFEVLRRITVESADLTDAEQDIFGFTHSMVGAELARQWNLPASLVAAIEYHHAPTSTDTYQLEASIVHCADAIGASLKSAAPELEQAPSLVPRAWDNLGISFDDMDSIVEEAEAGFSAIRTALLPTANAA